MTAISSSSDLKYSAGSSSSGSDGGDKEFFVLETVLVGGFLCLLILIGIASIIYQCQRLSTKLKNRKRRDLDRQQRYRNRKAKINAASKNKKHALNSSPEESLRSARGKTHQELQQELISLQKVQLDTAQQLSHLKKLLLLQQQQQQQQKERSANNNDKDGEDGDINPSPTASMTAIATTNSSMSAARRKNQNVMTQRNDFNIEKKNKDE